MFFGICAPDSNNIFIFSKLWELAASSSCASDVMDVLNENIRGVLLYVGNCFFLGFFF